MRGYWHGLITGAVIGAVATVFYKNNKKEIEHSTRRVMARYKQAKKDLVDAGQENLNDLIGKQDS